MTSKHTPGPWTIDDYGTIEAKHLGRVGFLTHASPADTDLIAAAPDMYAALKAVEWAGPRFCCPECLSPKVADKHEPKCRLANAIAKAEGRS